MIISGPPAIGKTTVAQGLAEEFNLKHLSGGDILKEMAEAEGFSSHGDDWWDTQDGMNFLEKRKINTDFDKKVDEKLQELFHQGNVVITSYTLPWLVNDGIKLWLSGSFVNSARRMKARDNVTELDALEVVKKDLMKTRKFTNHFIILNLDRIFQYLIKSSTQMILMLSKC